MTPQRLFIETYKNDVIESTSGTSIFPSVKMAQMILETNWGKSRIGNNMFGIKAKGAKTPFWDGSLNQAKTTEVIDGKSGTYTEPFRAYKTVADSIRDHSYFILTNSRYKNAGVFDAVTYQDQAKALQKAGYATDPDYADKLIQIISWNQLYDLDKKKRT